MRRPAPALTAVCAVAMAVAAAPAAASNLLVNPGAEVGPATVDVLADPPAPPEGWTTTGGFSQVSYNSPELGSVRRPAGSGLDFFAGGPNSDRSTATQDVDVSGAAGVIDAGDDVAALSADIGGFGPELDSGQVEAIFLDDAGLSLGEIKLGPVTLDDRGGPPIGDFDGYGQTELLTENGRAPIPAGTRVIRVVLTAVRVDGSYDDGYFDNVSLSLSTLGRLPDPVFGRSFDVRRVAGKVSVKARGARHAVPLRSPVRLPVGATVDATHGAAELTTAVNGLGWLQSGTFRGGAFRVTQPRGLGGFAVIRLTGGGVCPAGGVSAARRRHLFGNAHGRFQNRGGHSIASIRGTEWSVSDNCRTTMTSVSRGVVRIHDVVRRIVVPIASGVSPSPSEYDPVHGQLTASPPSGAARPHRRASHSYVAG